MNNTQAENHKRITRRVKVGVVALSINVEGKITRASIVYDSRDLSATSRNELAALMLEPLRSEQSVCRNELSEEDTC